MKNKFLSRTLLWLIAFAMLMPLPLLKVAAEEDVLTVDDPLLDVSTEVTAADISATTSQVDNATTEATETLNTTGTLIEIGNTTADNTTIIIRTTDAQGNTEDQTVEVDMGSTSIVNNSGTASSLSDWIAGDQISFSATEYTNSGAIVAGKLRNLAHKLNNIGKNGWIAALRPEENEMDVTWGNQVFTLNTTDAKMVSGIHNPATLSDFKIGDRIRARVVDDGDGNPLTWKAQIVVVLRRGNALFMRVTRWVVPAEIYSIPEDLSLPITIEVKILPSEFFEANDVNNLVGNPGEIIKVDINENTKLVRKFFGKAYLKEFSEGDELKIIGRRDETSGHLVAKFIKNNSIQKLGKVMRIGKINSIDTANNTLNITLIRTRRAIRNWTIQVTPATKIIKNGQTITLADILNTDKIRIVGGSANFTTNTVLAPAKIIIVKPTIATPITDESVTPTE